MIRINLASFSSTLPSPYDGRGWGEGGGSSIKDNNRPDLVPPNPFYFSKREVDKVSGGSLGRYTMIHD